MVQMKLTEKVYVKCVNDSGQLLAENNIDESFEALVNSST
jgi:hypothetical protein